METKIKSQKFRIIELLSVGWQIYCAKFTSILLVTLCVYIPFNTIVSFIPTDAFTVEYGVSAFRFYNTFILLLHFLIGTILTMSIATIIENAIEDQNLHWIDTIKFSLSKWGKAIGTGLLSGFILVGLTLLLIIPGIIYSQYYTFWVFVVVLRNKNGIEALNYSKNLVNGQWWRVFGIQLAIGFLYMLVILISAYPLNFVHENQVLIILLNTLLNIIGTFFTTTSTLFFLNNDYVYHPQPKVKITPIEAL